MEMEQDSKKKRVREGDDNIGEQRDVCSSKRRAKKQDISEDSRHDDDEGDSHRYKTTSEEDLGHGVFDFPWLKDDGVAWKPDEYWKLDDVFSSPLDETSSTITTAAGFEFSFSSQCLCQSPPEALLDFPPAEEDKPEESDALDCIWTSLLNQPLQLPH